MGRNVCMCFVMTVSTYIALNALEILMTHINSIDIYIVFDDMMEKPSVSVFQNCFQIENQLNIWKVMCRNVCMCFVLTVSTYIALNACNASILCLDSVDIHNIHNIQ